MPNLKERTRSEVEVFHSNSALHPLFKNRGLLYPIPVYLPSDRVFLTNNWRFVLHKSRKKIAEISHLTIPFLHSP